MSGKQQAVPGSRLLDELTLLLEREPGAVRQIHEQHVPDGQGKCRVCGDRARGTHPAWPCALVVCAQRTGR